MSKPNNRRAKADEAADTSTPATDQPRRCAVSRKKPYEHPTSRRRRPGVARSKRASSRWLLATLRGRWGKNASGQATPPGGLFRSVSAGRDHTWARELWHAGTWLFVGGAAVSVLAALTGLWDWWKSSEAGTQARRTINTHAAIMLTVTVLALVDIAWRLSDYRTAPVTPGPIAVLSVVIALLVSVGAMFGGSLVYDYGFNVETAGDHPVWHKSETDVFPARHD